MAIATGEAERDPLDSMAEAPGRIQWFSDLVRLEIALWARIDARLRQEHTLSLAFFEALYFIGQAQDGSLRVGDLAEALRITVGAASKLADRVELAGLIRREPDVTDRRVSRLVLTASGKRTLVDASGTYETELALVLDVALSADDQRHLHHLVRRVLAATN